MIVIPMAGLSQRFTVAGYDRPKYMLELAGQPVFDHAIASFDRYFTTERFLFVAREIGETRSFVEERIATLGITRAEVVILTAPTRGQAETVRLGLAGTDAGDDESLTIFNIDTFRPGFCYPDTDWFHRVDGYLEVMSGSDPGFSYVKPADAGEQRVACTAEKRVISPLASTGLYWFRRTADFLQSLEETQSQESGELYIAPLYNRLIELGRDIRYHQVANDDVVFCGTPTQYETLLHQG